MTFERWLQSRLTAHGYACGPIDGVIGDTTLAALNAFKRQHGLLPDGLADAVTVECLRKQSSAITEQQKAWIPDRDKGPGAPSRGSSPWPRQKDVPAFYGKVGTRQVKVEIPYDMVLAWQPSTRIRSITLHERVADSAARVFARLVETYSLREIATLGLDRFGGSLNVRRMRGGSAYSMHSWGIAIDFDPERNRLHWHAPKPRLSHPDAVPFWEAWEAEGWLSLGRARDFDWMHVQGARL